MGNDFQKAFSSDETEKRRDEKKKAEEQQDSGVAQQQDSFVHLLPSGVTNFGSGPKPNWQVEQMYRGAASGNVDYLGALEEIKDPDSVGMVLDAAPFAGAMWRCGQAGADELFHATDRGVFHDTMCGVGIAATGTTVAMGGLNTPATSTAAVAARVAAEGSEAAAVVGGDVFASLEGLQGEELEAALTAGTEGGAAAADEVTAAEEAVTAVKNPAKIPVLHSWPGMVAVIAAPPIVSLTDCKKLGRLTPHCKTLVKQQKEEAKQLALEKIKAEQLRLEADIWEQAFEDQGVWDTDFRPQLVPAIAQSPQQEDEPMLAHDVVPPTLEPDLQPMQSVSAPLQSANLQTTGAALVLTGVVLYAAYSTYASA